MFLKHSVEPQVSSSLVLSGSPVNKKVDLKCNVNPLKFWSILSSHNYPLHLCFRVVLWMRKCISSVNSSHGKQNLNHVLTCTHRFKRLIGNNKKHWIFKHFSFLISNNRNQPLEPLIEKWKWFKNFESDFAIQTYDGSQWNSYSPIV